MSTTETTTQPETSNFDVIVAKAIEHTVSDPGDPDSYLWGSWKTRKRKTPKAFAIRTSDFNGTGILRSINGAKVPDSAQIETDPDVERDHFCLQIIANHASGTARVSKKRKPRAKNPASAKAEKLEHAVDPPETYLKKDGERYLVVYEGGVVGSFLLAKLDDVNMDVPLDIKVTEKTWSIRQSGKQVKGLRGKRVNEPLPGAESADDASEPESAEATEAAE